MNIAIIDIYEDAYVNDRCFDLSTSAIGENLLLPGIKLKEKLESMGHEYHTADMYDIKDIDRIIFQDIPPYSWYTLENIKNLVWYIFKGKYKNDFLLKAVKNIPKENRILMIMEPPVVVSKSYNTKYHSMFGKILTWGDDLADGERYRKFCYPQFNPERNYDIPFSQKKFMTMICGKKRSSGKGELYSERRKVIDYFEKNQKAFDLYGFGWETENLKNYKGTLDGKLDTLAQYRYSICYENMCGINGYITEKIFDCFFARCVPIYWGAENIADYIPSDTFVDRRQFKTLDEMIEFVENISEKEYGIYIDNINKFLNSSKFKDVFSVEAYVDNMTRVILE